MQLTLFSEDHLVPPYPNLQLNILTQPLMRSLQLLYLSSVSTTWVTVTSEDHLAPPYLDLPYQPNHF